jgi:Xaa-Pro aminopeptidase
MLESFPSSFFKDNRDRLRTLFSGNAPIVITANALLQQKADTPYPFRQDSTFWYLTGINEPGMVLVMDKNKDYLINPVRSKYNDVFDGAIDDEDLEKRSGIKTVMENQEGWKHLGNTLKRVRHVAVASNPPSYIETYNFYTNPARSNLVDTLKTYNSELTLLDLGPHIIKMRSIKQQIELDAINSAIDITSKTIMQVKKALPKAKYEYEIEAMIISGFKKAGAGEAFASIVSAGKNNCTLHYLNGHSEIKPKDLVLVDVGAEVAEYSADLARTYAVSKPSKRQQQVFDSVKEVQSYAFGLLKPGVVVREYEDKIEHYMGEKLRTLGLINTIDRESVRKYFPTATSHFLGLDTHDIGDYRAPLQPGMVLTVEPGIYIPEEGIGVRIEDDVLITEAGNKNLSAKLPSLII